MSRANLTCPRHLEALAWVTVVCTVMHLAAQMHLASRQAVEDDDEAIFGGDDSGKRGKKSGWGKKSAAEINATLPSEQLRDSNAPSSPQSAEATLPRLEVERLGGRSHPSGDRLALGQSPLRPSWYHKAGRSNPSGDSSSAYESCESLLR